MHGLEVELRRHSGEPIVVLVSAEALDVGERCLLTVLHDITERKRIEAQLRQAQKMEALGTLAGGIAHDFNNLLSALVGFTSLQPTTCPGRARLGAPAGRAGGRQPRQGPAQQILTFSRRREQERKPVALPSCPGVPEARPCRGSDTIEIREQVDPRAGTVLADPTQIHQVLLNLCTNAEHAMRERAGFWRYAWRPSSWTLPSPQPTSHCGGPHIRLVVGDTGYGMAPDIRERIFDPFFTTKGPGEEPAWDWPS